MKVSNVVRGTEYGEIIKCETATYKKACEIVALAQKKGLIDYPYDTTEWSRKRGKFLGDMLNTDMYDVAPGRALVQYRYLTMHRYGSTVQKEYFLVTRKGGKVTVTDMEDAKPRIMKLAKSNLPLGSVIASITGKKVVKILVKTAIKQVGYKAMIRKSGTLISVWDGTTWEMNKTKTQQATPNHQGGYYCYRNLSDCITAAQSADIFGEAREHSNLVVVKVETSGRTYNHNAKYGIKICTTNMTIKKIIGKIPELALKEAA